ncbi:MAG: PD40 domain-containing protein, partial [Planctomycetes bacterium]|nr:PD40 domain-containing protein [Planctomycetota bacterium]
MTRWLFLILLGTAPLVILAQQPAGDPPRRLLIAFSSYKDRPKHAQVYFYEHDGVSKGKIVGSIDTVANRQDYHPILSKNGKICVFASELENQTSKIFVYDLAQKKLVTPPKLNDSTGALLHPTINADGTVIAFAAWDNKGAGQRWDVLEYDLAGQKYLDAPKLNTPKFDSRMPAMSANGRWLAYVSNRKDGVGLSDLWLYDRQESKVIALPELNSPRADLTPSLSEDGNLIAFASDRAGGMGGRDIYLYDRNKKSYLSLPGVNSVANEQSPSLSPDGRYLVFVSERIKGEGERDIYL